MAQVGSDLDLWNIISKKDGGCSTSELAKQVGADPVLMGEFGPYFAWFTLTLLCRILRYLASFRMISEISEDKFGATNITKALTKPGLKSCVFTE